MKRIGIIGGLGPLATAKFMELLNEKLVLTNEEVELVVINDPTTPDRPAYILDNNHDNPINNILDMVKKLEISQSNVIVMPCNTASYFYKEIQNNTKVPFINIVEETVKYLSNHNIKKIGLLATCGTIKSKIYEDLLNHYHIECVIPKQNDQEIISKVIYDGVKSNKDIDLTDFFNITKKLLDEGCEKIILGCTELSALRKMKNMYQDEFLDAMEILADNTIKFIEKDS